MTNEAIDAVVADLRRIHPELERPLTWTTMSLILKRENISLLTLPLVHDAQVISCDGVSVIAINSNAPVARHTYFAAHEWGHIKLHFREPGEIVYHTSACWPDDPREDDAERFATMLLLGPTQPVAGDVEGMVTRRRDIADGRPLVGTRKRRRAPDPPAQTRLPMPIDDPYRPNREDSIRMVLKGTSPKLRKEIEARERREQAERAIILDLRPRHELVIGTENGKAVRKHYLIDRDGVRWRVYDMLQPGRMSTRGKAYPVEPPHNWATERVFVRDDGTRRHCMLRFREPRDLEPRFLEAQLDRAQ